MRTHAASCICVCPRFERRNKTECMNLRVIFISRHLAFTQRYLFYLYVCMRFSFAFQYIFNALNAMNVKEWDRKISKPKNKEMFSIFFYVRRDFKDKMSSSHIHTKSNRKKLTYGTSKQKENSEKLKKKKCKKNTCYGNEQR